MMACILLLDKSCIMFLKADNASTVNTKLSLNEVLTRFSAAPGYDASIAAAADRCCLGYVYCKSSLGAVQVLTPGTWTAPSTFFTAGSKVLRMRAGTLGSCLNKTGRPGLHHQFL